MIPKNHQEIIDFANKCQIKSDGRLHAPILFSHKKIKSNKITYICWQIIIGIHRESIKMDYIYDRSSDYKGIPYVITISKDVPSESNPQPKSRISKPTFVKNGKNLNRSNYTTSLTQAIRDARSKYIAKVKQGFVDDINEIITNYTFDDLLNQNKSYPWRVIPMALKDVNAANNWQHVKYPCYIQRKLDGTRLILVNTNEMIDAYSRSRKDRQDSSIELIKNDMREILEKNPGLYFDGEFYKHGALLQETSGKSRRITNHEHNTTDNMNDNTTDNTTDNINDNINDNTDVVEKFYIFDCFTIPSKPYNERKKQLQNIFNEYDNLKYCKMVETIVVNNYDELMEQYNEIIQEYEGIVIRNFDSLYEYAIHKELRSNNTMKMKPRFDTEFDVIGYTQGKRGKDVEAIVWVCRINNSSMKYMVDTFGKKYPSMAKTLDDVNASHEFTAIPNLTYHERYALYRYLEDNEDDSYKEYMATIEFASASLDAKPQQPKFIRFRDLDYNRELINRALEYYDNL